MKKNLLTILLIVMAFMNLTLSIVLVIAVVPAANKTNHAVTKVAQILDLELESKEPTPELSVEDIEPYNFTERITVNLAQSAGQKNSQFAQISLSLSLNKTSKDYEVKTELIAARETKIREIVSETFGKYTKDTVLNSKEEIKKEILAGIEEEFQSDFIIGVSFGDIVIP